MRFPRVVLVVGVLAVVAVDAGAARADACSAAQQKDLDALRRSILGPYLQKNWTAMEAHYQRMAATTCELTDVDYNWGGIAARGLGDIGAALERYQKIKSPSGPHPYGEMRPRFGKASITATKGTKLTRTGGPSLPDDGVAAMRFVTVKLDLKGGFDGYLPLGTYDIGDKHFAVTKDSDVKIEFNPKIGWNVTGG